MRPVLFVAAAEPSGEHIAVEFAEALRAIRPDITLVCAGGAVMRRAGLDVQVDTGGLQVFGLLDGFRVAPYANALAQRIAEAAVEARADAMVLIDSWGLFERVAGIGQTLAPDMLRVKYIGPQVWASRPWRAKALARRFDHLFCAFEIERPFYEGLDVGCTVIGYPPVARGRLGDRSCALDRLALNGSCPRLGVFFGSRPSEIRRLGPVLKAAVDRIVDAVPVVQTLTLRAANVSDDLDRLFEGWANAPASAPPGAIPPEDVFAACDVALCCSGTVTTEAAMQGPALVVGYRADALTWIVAKSGVMTSEFITLLNIAAGERIVPEFLQGACTPEALADACVPLLTDEAARRTQIARQEESLDLLGRGGRPPAEVAAEAMVALLASRG